MRGLSNRHETNVLFLGLFQIYQEVYHADKNGSSDDITQGYGDQIITQKPAPG